MPDGSVSVRASAEFDRLVGAATVDNPRKRDGHLRHSYEPNFDLLTALPAVPLRLRL